MLHPKKYLFNLPYNAVSTLLFAAMRSNATEIGSTLSGSTRPPLTPSPEYKISMQMRNFAMPEPERILRIRTVLERTGLSRSTLYRKMREGTFPNQVRISEHCRGWRESAINNWIGDPVGYTENKVAETLSGSTVRSRKHLLAQ
jgi:prophage regulatory protein